MQIAFLLGVFTLFFIIAERFSSSFFFLAVSLPVSFMLTRIAYDELAAGNRWFICLILIGFFGFVLSFIYNNTALTWWFAFIVLTTLVSLTCYMARNSNYLKSKI